MGQFDIFGREVAQEPGAAAPDDATLALAARLPPRLALGTSSWNFAGWKGLVYEGAWTDEALAARGLGAYARHPLLGAVAVDRTHYAPVEAGTLADWASQVPEGFRFVVKAHEVLGLARFPRHPRYGRHAGEPNPRFLDAAYATDAVVGPYLEGLGDKGWALLFQLAPQPVDQLGGAGVFADRLYRFLDALPRGPRYAVEPRTPALLTRAYADALVGNGAVHSWLAWTGMPPIAEQMRLVTGGARFGLLVRWMLGHGLDYETAKARYAPFHRLVAPDLRTRAEIARLVRLAVDRGVEAVVIANNKAEGSAPLTLARLAEAVTGSAEAAQPLPER